MSKLNKVSIAVATAAIATAIVPVAVSAWGDNTAGGNGRASYTLAQINEGKLGNTITFNSISNSVIGDEKNFVGARIADGTAKGPNNIWNANEITVKDGQEYYIRIYAHNNNPNGLNAVAKDTTVTFSIPGTTGKEIKVTGFIDSSNATPTEYWDSVVFKSDSNFHLEYIAGSALLENNGIGANGGVKLSDNIITNGGVKIGYSALDGNVPGCYTYANYVTIKVKAVYDAPYSIDTRVRLAGSDKWVEEVDAKEGDIVEYILLYKNLSSSQQNNVVLKDVLPENMEYVKGSTYLYNANHKDGIINNDDTITTHGVNIGSYAAGTNAYVIFKAKVVNKSLACGTTKLVNWGQAGVGDTTLQDSAKVYVARTCEEKKGEDPTPQPTPESTPKTETTDTMPKTGPESIVAGIVGAGAITTAAGYFIASRKKLA